MTEPSNWLVHDHRKYDIALDECEIAAGAGEWKEAITLFRGFLDDLRLHVQMEEEVVYPAFEQETGDPHGEIAELREEHEYLVRLLRDITVVVRTKDYDHFLESLVPLHRIMNRHNRHEEDIFLRLGNESLLMRREEILSRLRGLERKAGKRVWDF
jgi:hemerythrin-like domain-containing protein